MLDMDEPHEVTAAGYKFTTAMNTLGEQVEKITRDFVVPRRPEAKVEFPLAACTRWMRAVFHDAVEHNNGRGVATGQYIADASSTYGHADDAGGARVRRTDYV